MRRHISWLPPAVEVCEGDKLYGYVIRFSGGWDVYEMTNTFDLARVATNLKRVEDALKKLGIDQGLQEDRDRIAELENELRAIGHIIAGGGPISGYKRAAKKAEERWYSTTRKLIKGD